jgi:DHA1 family 2-module integral membrane pump EmrD-like MFS transporter
MDNTNTISRSGERLIIFLSLLIIVVTPFAADSYTPSLPAITKSLHSNTHYMQLTMAIYLLGVALSQLFYGPLSDSYGRRPIILIGLGITFLGSVLCAFATSLTFLLAARFIQGAGAGVCNALYRALLRDCFSGAKMAQAGSYASMFYTRAYSIAPILGGYIEFYYGWRMNFMCISLIILIIFLLLWCLLPETHTTRTKVNTLKTIFHNYYTLLSSFTFISYTFISSLALSGLIAYYTVAPFLMQNVVGLTAVEFGWMSIGLAAGMFIGQYINARYVIKYGIYKMLHLGVAIMLLSGLIMLSLALHGVINIYSIIFPIGLFSVGAGLVFSNAMAAAFQAFGHIAGSGGAMYGFLQILGTSLTSLFVSTLHTANQLPLAIIFTSLGCVALITVGIVRLVE